MDNIIGGVFPLETVSAPPSQSSLLSTWTADSDAIYLFHNARSAIRHVVADQNPRRIWLPAYLCSSIVQAIQDGIQEIHYYAVDGRLEVDHTFVKESVHSGDAVLTINYFGKPSSPAFRAALANAKDILWIEDCAQTLSTNEDDYGDVRIYSPRKIAGVPDGGILAIQRGNVRPPALKYPPNDDFMQPYTLRAEDPKGNRREEWYPAFQEAENAMAPCDWAMSDVSKNILEGIDADSICSKRLENYNHLLQELGDLALFPSPPSGWIPFGFPLLTQHHEKLWDHLKARQVYAPRHWRDIPSPRDRFPEAHALSNELMTIPCDQRYDLNDMARVVRLIREVCP